MLYDDIVDKYRLLGRGVQYLLWHLAFRERSSHLQSDSFLFPETIAPSLTVIHIKIYLSSFDQILCYVGQVYRQFQPRQPDHKLIDKLLDLVHNLCKFSLISLNIVP